MKSVPSVSLGISWGSPGGEQEGVPLSWYVKAKSSWGLSAWSRRVLVCRQSVLGYYRVCGGSHEGMQLKVPFSQFAYRGIMESWQKVMSMAGV